MTRAKFENICAPIFRSAIPPVRQALEDANLQKEEIDEILLVGGTTRIPMVRQVVQEFFNGKEMNKMLNPDECVCIGACIQANILAD